MHWKFAAQKCAACTPKSMEVACVLPREAQLQIQSQGHPPSSTAQHSPHPALARWMCQQEAPASWPEPVWGMDMKVSLGPAIGFSSRILR